MFSTLQTDSMQTFKPTLEHDGSRYCGWHEQVNERTVQSELKEASLGKPALSYAAAESRMSFKV